MVASHCLSGDAQPIVYLPCPTRIFACPLLFGFRCLVHTQASDVVPPSAITLALILRGFFFRNDGVTSALPSLPIHPSASHIGTTFFACARVTFFFIPQATSVGALLFWRAWVTLSCIDPESTYFGAAFFGIRDDGGDGLGRGLGNRLRRGAGSWFRRRGRAHRGGGGRFLRGGGGNIRRGRRGGLFILSSARNHEHDAQGGGGDNPGAQHAKAPFRPGCRRALAQATGIQREPRRGRGTPRPRA